MRSERVLRRLPELYQLERWAEELPSSIEVSILDTVIVGNEGLPIYCFSLGNQAENIPQIIFTGGVHGVERIGTQVLIAFMNTLFERLRWDQSINDLLNRVRIQFVPIVNPGGMLLGKRANPDGVDLMRNAPVDASQKVPALLGGHRMGRFLPWYRGKKGQAMQMEAQALSALVVDTVCDSPFSISLDCHSGFGHRDRVWFPYARTADPFDDIGEMYAFRLLFRRTYPNYSFYRIEPQSMQYTTHGDLWDYLYLVTQDQRASTYLPLTLEMGSWIWVKKNPLQLFKSMGMYNPMLPHRQERVLRRHQCLLEFVVRAAANYQDWLPETGQRREWMHQAIDYWY